MTSFSDNRTAVHVQQGSYPARNILNPAFSVPIYLAHWSQGDPLFMEV